MENEFFKLISALEGLISELEDLISELIESSSPLVEAINEPSGLLYDTNK